MTHTSISAVIPIFMGDRRISPYELWRIHKPLRMDWKDSQRETDLLKFIAIVKIFQTFHTKPVDLVQI